MTTDRDDLEPIEPETAQELFLNHKATDCTDSTVQNHRYRLNPFVRWYGKNGIDNLNELSGRNLQRYRLWREEDGDLNKLTLRVLLKWAGSIETVPQNLYGKMIIPRVCPEERKRDEILEVKDAQDIMDYLSKCEYSSSEHAVMALLWQSGIRVGSVHLLNVDDVFVDQNYVQLIHRPGFRRTPVGLKHAGVGLSCLSRDRFRRTLVGLKQLSDKHERGDQYRFRRTLVGLKKSSPV